jgi:hypothetical protein
MVLVTMPCVVVPMNQGKYDTQLFIYKKVYTQILQLLDSCSLGPTPSALLWVLNN